MVACDHQPASREGQAGPTGVAERLVVVKTPGNAGRAKGSPHYRFYALYDKLSRWDVLAHAYACCKANRGAAGVDGQKFTDIEAYGLDRWLGELAEELRTRRYRPQAFRRVYIPSANGGQRPLGIPTVTDRVVQMAAVLVLGPIFETDLQPEQHAY